MDRIERTGFWHFDHNKQRYIKGVNFMSSLLVCDDVSIFFGVEFVKKNIWVTNAKIVKPQRKSSKSKNELFREMVNNINDRMAIDYVLADS